MLELDGDGVERGAGGRADTGRTGGYPGRRFRDRGAGGDGGRAVSGLVRFAVTRWQLTLLFSALLIALGLAAFKAIPRTEVTKRLWAYIKKNKLQDSKNRRQINADATLKAVFGGKSSVNMFDMTKLVGKHLK